MLPWITMYVHPSIRVQLRPGINSQKSHPTFPSWQTLTHLLTPTAQEARHKKRHVQRTTGSLSAFSISWEHWRVWILLSSPSTLLWINKHCSNGFLKKLWKTASSREVSAFSRYQLLLTTMKSIFVYNLKIKSPNGEETGSSRCNSFLKLRS